MLKNESQDIESIIVKMRKQFFDMRSQYLEELNEIEKEFITDRK